MWEKLKAGIETLVAYEPDQARRQAVQDAFQVGLQYVDAALAGEVPAGLAVAYQRADEQVLSKIRLMLGLDQVRAAISGAAPIAPEILKFMLALGIPVTEVWGMSECSCIGTANLPDAIRIGTVGKAIPGVQLKLAGDGELLLRGPIVMKGYRNDPARTAEAIDPGGWLHTGDLAAIDEDGYVTITGRKKELIINAAGKNMSPAAIESAVLAASLLIAQVVAVGDRRPYIIALIALDPDAAAAFAAQHGITDPAPAILAAHPAIRAAIGAAVEEANGRLSRAEQIKRFAVVPTFWEPGGDEITPTMKLKRRAVTAKYADVIDSLYAPAAELDRLRLHAMPASRGISRSGGQSRSGQRGRRVPASPEVALHGSHPPPGADNGYSRTGHCQPQSRSVIGIAGPQNSLSNICYGWVFSSLLLMSTDHSFGVPASRT